MKLIANQAEIDRKAFLQFGIPPEVLMRTAGTRVAEVVKARCASSQTGVIVCGPGNNGGDGFVCAQVLYRAGFQALSVLYTGAQYRGEALHYLERLLMEASIPIIDVLKQMEPALSRLAQADFIVDALFGSGLSRPIGGVEARLIEAIQKRREAIHERRADKTEKPVWVLSVDLPSGIDGRSGQVLGRAVQADETVAFTVGKPGLYLYPGKAHAGRVSIVDIGIPSALVEEEESPFRLLTTEQARDWLPPIRPEAHKYDCGSVLVIAGSRKMPGAAALCAEAAMSSGAGLVTLAAPAGALAQLSLMPEIMRLPLPDESILTEASLEALQKALSDPRLNAVVLGPGLGREPETVQAVLKLLEILKSGLATVVVDADALNILATGPMTLNDRFILTPHVGEAARLLGESPDTLQADLPAAADRLRRMRRAHIVLKSATTVIAPLSENPSETLTSSPDVLWLSSAGNPGMATAGSGDVLSGIIGALGARLHAAGLPVSHAALLGVHLHGLAGDAAAQRLTPYAMRASDITRSLPEAFRQLV